jgi:hypothetical protein
MPHPGLEAGRCADANVSLKKFYFGTGKSLNKPGLLVFG